MSYGMVYYQDHEIETFDDLDDYCYYVAGTVGVYLTKLVKEVDDKELSTDYAKSFARFLQKVNIIKDVSKDLNENRFFWPNSLFENINIKDIFENEKYKDKALNILNTMVDNAISEFENTVYYITSIDDKVSKGYKEFTLISSIMAYETLKLMRNNYNIFLGKTVKIPKTLTLEIMAKIKMGVYTDKELLMLLAESKSI